VFASCQNCGEPPSRTYDGWLLCEKCAGRFEESDQQWAEYQSGRIVWNASVHDPFWRGWLTSWELFATIHEFAPRVGNHIHSVAGGEVYECLRDVLNVWLQVWVADSELIATYATEAGLLDFVGLVRHLRNSPALELGQVRDGSSYGAVSAGVGVPPVVKWAQAGDWAATARAWFMNGRPLAPWP
jgi:hypothetical protein